MSNLTKGTKRPKRCRKWLKTPNLRPFRPKTCNLLRIGFTIELIFSNRAVPNRGPLPKGKKKKKKQGRRKKRKNLKKLSLCLTGSRTMLSQKKLVRKKTAEMKMTHLPKSCGTSRPKAALLSLEISVGLVRVLLRKAKCSPTFTWVGDRNTLLICTLLHLPLLLCRSTSPISTRKKPKKVRQIHLSNRSIRNLRKQRKRMATKEMRETKKKKTRFGRLDSFRLFIPSLHCYHAYGLVIWQPDSKPLHHKQQGQAEHSLSSSHILLRSVCLRQKTLCAKIEQWTPEIC
mmetsp:Transcript_4175/g.6525  ORF Transcript_4175/g.6525 Transcript_4175/m.6525 type:complete len:287 (-) Transcript_4175:122-982(-)